MTDSKHAIVVLAPEDTPEGRGRILHAFYTARDLASEGAIVEIYLDGIGVTVLTAFAEPNNQFTTSYASFRRDSSTHQGDVRLLYPETVRRHLQRRSARSADRRRSRPASLARPSDPRRVHLIYASEVFIGSKASVRMLPGPDGAS